MAARASRTREEEEAASVEALRAVLAKLGVGDGEGGAVQLGPGEKLRLLKLILELTLDNPGEVPAWLYLLGGALRAAHTMEAVVGGRVDEGPEVAAAKCEITGNFAIHPNFSVEGYAWKTDPLTPALPMVLAALRAYGASHATVAEEGCFAVANLYAGPFGRARYEWMFNRGVVGLVAAALRAHGNGNAYVAFSACLSLALLTREHLEAVIEEVVAHGCVPLLVDVLRTHGTRGGAANAIYAQASSWACDTLANVARRSPGRCELMWRHGALVALLAAAVVHGRSNAGLALSVCDVVVSLATCGTGEGPRLQEMLRAGALEVVRDLVATHRFQGRNGAMCAMALRLLGNAAARRCCDGPGCVRAGRQRCSRCHRTRYCSAECQRAHWSHGHKAECHLQLKGASAELPATCVRTCDGPGCERTADRALGRCSRCGATRYCSHECQRAHWKGGHRAECHARVKQRGETDE